MATKLCFPFAKDSERKLELFSPPTWFFTGKDFDQEAHKGNLCREITTSHQLEKNQCELLIKEISITNGSENQSSSKPLILSVTNKCLHYNIQEISLISNARFIEVYYSDRQYNPDEPDNPASVYVTTMKGSPVPLENDTRKLFTHEFIFPDNYPNEKKMFIQLKFLSIKSNTPSTISCSFLHWRILLQLDTLQTLRPSPLAEKMSEIKAIREELSPQHLLAMSNLLHQGAAPAPNSSPFPPASSFMLKSMVDGIQADFLRQFEKMLDQKLAPVFDRLGRLETKLCELSDARQRQKSEDEVSSLPLSSL